MVMIRMATIYDIDNLVNLRIKLLNEANKNVAYYDWDKIRTIVENKY